MSTEQEPSAPQSKLVQEIHSYLSYPRLTPKEVDGFQLLEWWSDNEKVFPILSKVAKAIHAVVATSASSERMFSKAGNVVTAKRSRIAPSNVDRFVFLHQNLHQMLEDD